MAASARIWAFGGGKGGVGKSLVCASVGTVLARRGRRVVALDADLGAANLHTLVGVLHPERTLDDFFTGRATTLDEVCLPTEVDGLRIVSGAAAILRAAHPRPTERVRLARALALLDADHILIDLGAGTHYNTLDFFNLAAEGVVVTGPEPTSIQNAYAFVKASLYRSVERALVAFPESRAFVQRAVHPRAAGDLDTMRSLLAALDANDPAAAAVARGLLSDFRAGLVVNQAGPRDVKRVVGALGVVCRRYLDYDLELLGSLPADPEVALAVRRMRPVLRDVAASGFAAAIEGLVDRLLTSQRAARPEAVTAAPEFADVSAIEEAEAAPRPAPSLATEAPTSMAEALRQAGVGRRAESTPEPTSPAAGSDEGQSPACAPPARDADDGWAEATVLTPSLFRDDREPAPSDPDWGAEERTTVAARSEESLPPSGDEAAEAAPGWGAFDVSAEPASPAVSREEEGAASLSPALEPPDGEDVDTADDWPSAIFGEKPRQTASSATSAAESAPAEDATNREFEPSAACGDAVAACDGAVEPQAGEAASAPTPTDVQASGTSGDAGGADSSLPGFDATGESAWAAFASLGEDRSVPSLDEELPAWPGVASSMAEPLADDPPDGSDDGAREAPTGTDGVADADAEGADAWMDEAAEAGAEAVDAWTDEVAEAGAEDAGTWSNEAAEAGGEGADAWMDEAAEAGAENVGAWTDEAAEACADDVGAWTAAAEAGAEDVAAWTDEAAEAGAEDVAAWTDEAAEAGGEDAGAWTAEAAEAGAEDVAAWTDEAAEAGAADVAAWTDGAAEAGAADVAAWTDEAAEAGAEAVAAWTNEAAEAGAADVAAWTDEAFEASARSVAAWTEEALESGAEGTVAWGVDAADTGATNTGDAADAGAGDAIGWTDEPASAGADDAAAWTGDGPCEAETVASTAFGDGAGADSPAGGDDATSRSVDGPLADAAAPDDDVSVWTDAPAPDEIVADLERAVDELLAWSGEVAPADGDIAAAHSSVGETEAGVVHEPQEADAFGSSSATSWEGADAASDEAAGLTWSAQVGADPSFGLVEIGDATGEESDAADAGTPPALDAEESSGSAGDARAASAVPSFEAATWASAPAFEPYAEPVWSVGPAASVPSAADATPVASAADEAPCTSVGEPEVPATHGDDELHPTRAEEMALPSDHAVAHEGTPAEAAVGAGGPSDDDASLEGAEPDAPSDVTRGDADVGAESPSASAGESDGPDEGASGEDDWDLGPLEDAAADDEPLWAQAPSPDELDAAVDAIAEVIDGGPESPFADIPSTSGFPAPVEMDELWAQLDAEAGPPSRTSPPTPADSAAASAPPGTAPAPMASGGLGGRILAMLAREALAGPPRAASLPAELDPWSELQIGGERTPLPARLGVDTQPLPDPPGHVVAGLDELVQSPEGPIHVQTWDLAPTAAVVRCSAWRDGQLLAHVDAPYRDLFGPDGLALAPDIVARRVAMLHAEAVGRVRRGGPIALAQWSVRSARAGAAA